jgi:hypothetical protein
MSNQIALVLEKEAALGTNEWVAFYSKHSLHHHTAPSNWAHSVTNIRGILVLKPNCFIRGVYGHDFRYVMSLSRTRSGGGFCCRVPGAEIVLVVGVVIGDFCCCCIQRISDGIFFCQLIIILLLTSLFCSCLTKSCKKGKHKEKH